MPKFTALALRRIWGVTSSWGTPNTWEAVIRWMSSPELKPSIMAWSPAMQASSRNSLWE